MKLQQRTWTVPFYSERVTLVSTLTNTNNRQQRHPPELPWLTDRTGRCWRMNCPTPPSPKETRLPPWAPRSRPNPHKPLYKGLRSPCCPDPGPRGRVLLKAQTLLLGDQRSGPCLCRASRYFRHQTSYLQYRGAQKTCAVTVAFARIEISSLNVKFWARM